MARKQRVCSIDGCENPLIAGGLCSGHYQRRRKTGDVQAGIPLRAFRPRPRRLCDIEGCERIHATGGLCNMHAIRMRNHGSVDLPEPVVYYGPEHPAWKGSDVTYPPAHTRVVRARGSASLHLCWNCGGQAQDWAYDHNDPNELTCQKTGRLYSGAVEHYRPLCRKCHKRIDNAARRGDVGCVLEVMAA